MKHIIVVLILLIATTGCEDKSKSQKETQSSEADQFDINKPVENPDLVNAIEQCNSNPNQENWSNVLKEIKESRLLAAIDTKNLDQQIAEGESETKVQLSGNFRLYLTSNEAGEILLLLFTDWQAIKNAFENPVNTLVLKPEDISGYVKSGNFKGVAINTPQRSITLSMDDLKYLMRGTE